MSKDVPSLMQVRSLAEGLLGREVVVQELGISDVPTGSNIMVGTYSEPSRPVGGVAIMDLALSIYMGAALGLLPAGGAEDMVAEEDPSATVLENAVEFLNTLAHPYFESTGVHHRLAQVYKPGDSVPQELLDGVESSLRRCVECEIKDYGKGTIALVSY